MLDTYFNKSGCQREEWKRAMVCKSMSVVFLQVVTVLSWAGVCEKASIDELYLDITEATTVR
jgi:nucleotidyltransferase/DNA polymerase involved in DNA repair